MQNRNFITISIFVLSNLVEVVNVVVLFKIHVCRMMGSFCHGAPFVVYVGRFSTY